MIKIIGVFIVGLLLVFAFDKLIGYIFALQVEKQSLENMTVTYVTQLVIKRFTSRTILNLITSVAVYFIFKKKFAMSKGKALLISIVFFICCLIVFSDSTYNLLNSPF